MYIKQQRKKNEANRAKAKNSRSATSRRKKYRQKKKCDKKKRAQFGQHFGVKQNIKWRQTKQMAEPQLEVGR